MKKKSLANVIKYVGLGSLVLPMTSLAAPTLEELNRKIEQLQNELQTLKESKTSESTNPSINEAIASAAEWKESSTLIHMAGYADVNYVDVESEDSSYNLGTFAPIFHYQYRDLVMLESELEIEVEDDGETEVKLEYLTVDVFLNDYMVLVAGKFLSPIGQFRQNLHPSWINKMATAPPGFGHDGAAPVSDLGVQLRGGFPLGAVRTNYAIYASNGPELKAEFEDGEFELDGVEAEGFGTDSDGEKVYGGRFAVIPFAGFEIGLSAATGKVTVTEVEGGDSSVLSAEGDRDYDVLGADFSWHYKQFNLRGEYVETDVGSTTEGAAASRGATWETWYTQGAYRLGDSKWEVAARYADFDSPHNSRDQQQWTLGVNYLLANNIVLKLNYELNDGQSGTEADRNRVLAQLAYGF